MFSLQRFMIIVLIAAITACGGKSGVKREPASDGRGGYYLDDGPGENPPADIDRIPDATPKSETLLVYPNKPYTALGKKYVPMTQYAPYVQQGVASWYGRRYHGKKTSSGEIYDMYGMSGAHPTLPIPSYVKVTNLTNKRSVIVRINDRGPFKRERLIDLSYAAAYKLRLHQQGSAMVEVEWIDTSADTTQKLAAPSSAGSANANATEISPLENAPAILARDTTAVKPREKTSQKNEVETSATYYVQVGAFKNEANSDQVQRKVLGLDIAGNAAVTKVYNDGIYRVKLGPFPTRKEAELSAGKVRKQLNTPAIITNQ